MKKTLIGIAAACTLPVFMLTAVPSHAARVNLNSNAKAQSKAPSTADKKRHLKPALPRLEAGSASAEAILNRR